MASEWDLYCCDLYLCGHGLDRSEVGDCESCDREDRANVIRAMRDAALVADGSEYDEERELDALLVASLIPCGLDRVFDAEADQMAQRYRKMRGAA